MYTGSSVQTQKDNVGHGHFTKLSLISLWLTLLLALTGGSKNTTATTSALLLSPPNCSVSLPNFKFPWDGNLNGKIYFTGGPHQWNNTIFNGTYPYGFGSGLDFSSAKGFSFPVIAMASGQIIEAGWANSNLGGLGYIIAIKSDVGPSVLIYGHLDGNSSAFIGSQNKLHTNPHVNQGDLIAYSGNSGNGSNYHLHIELRDGSDGTDYGAPIGWDCVGYTDGQIDGYWIWGYADNSSYLGANMYNYDGVAVKGDNYRLDTDFRYEDWYPTGSIDRTVTTVVGSDYVCPPEKYNNNDCEFNSYPSTQFAKIGTGGFWQNSSTISAQNVIAAQSLDLSAGILISTNHTNSTPADSATFISDITLPDGTVVSPGQSYTKTWRVKNTGGTTWGTGYQLAFISGEQMGASSAVDVPSTAPGQTADISVPMTAPTTSGLHTGYWQMRNPQGTYFGDQVWVKIKVLSGNTGSGHITSFDISPASPSSATVIHIVGRFRAFPDYRSARFVIGADSIEQPNIQLIGDQYQISADWQTDSLPRGNYAIAFEVASAGDLDWSHPERQIQTYTLTGSPTSSNHPPDRPILSSPYNWYLKDASGSSASVTLCANPVTDPDGDPVQYWFEVKDQGGGVYATSGWISNTCWTNTFDPNTYSWRAKAGDGSAESDWSQDTWNFSVAKGGVYIGDHSFFAQDTNDTHLCVFVTYDGIQAPDVYAFINLAADGSENGEWHLLDHYGPNTTPDCTQSNYHGFWIRSPLYETGTHKIKISAIKRDSGANAMMMTSLNISYIRPPEPNPLAPSSPNNNGTWWSTRTIDFRWGSSLRAESYTLRVSTNSDPWSDPSPVLNQAVNSDITSYIYVFSHDYGQLYWSVRASNSAGSADSDGNTWFGIDQINPSCQVQALPSVNYENVFQVNWSGIDDSSGVRSYNIQYLDTMRGTWGDWLLNAPAIKPYELFTGQAGHTYYFRCQATDMAGNTGDYPANADTFSKVDPAARPPAPWWNAAWTGKRNITILNNMASVTMPVGYPVHLHFDGSTTPTAAEMYAASQSSPKCDDLRIVYNDTTELNRIVDKCDTSSIDIWFRTSVVVDGGTSNNTAHQLYFGNASAGSPPSNRSQVFYPALDANYLRVFDMREGSGSTLSDATGNGSASISSELSWSSSGKFGPSVMIPGDLTPEPRPAIYADYGPQPSCAFTAEIWLKRLAGHNYGGQIAGQEIGGPNPWRWLFMLDGNNLRLSIEGISEAAISDGSLGAETFFNNWHHVAVTYNCSGQVQFYIDGVLDSTRSLPGSGLNSASAPLRIGNNAYSTQRLAAYVSGFALSNVVRTDFSYGQFANILTEPSVAAGTIVNPPISGNPDLVLLSLDAYPNPSGGVLVEAIVQNQGTLDTQNGFFTDLYVDHLPTGAGDYAGSLRFWVNDPVAAGATVMLTTVLNDLSAQSELTAHSLAPGAETTATLYAQTDSTGAVSEPDKSNNIYSTGTEICFASADDYEGDDSVGIATTISLDQTQTHNFDQMNDQDWVKFTAQAGQTYILSTSNLGSSADTYLYLYDIDGTTLLASNDDYEGTLASQIEWQAPADGTYYMLINDWNPNTGGCGTSYDFTINLAVTSCFSLATTSVPNGSGSVNANPQPDCESGTKYASGVSVALSANPATGYHFTNWSGDANNTNNTLNITMDSDKTITANFTLNTYTITGNAGESGVTLRYTDGTAKSVTSASNGRYTITVPYNWSGSVTPSKTGLTFSPASKSYSHITANQTNQNFSAVLTIPSTGSYDGYILESTETSNVGGSVNATNTYFVIGDASADRQYRAILAFNTASLPDTATIQSVVVKIKQYGSPVGSNPFSILGSLYTDIRKGYFGTGISLQTTDFNAAASTTSVAATFGKTPVSSWYSATLTSTARSYVNKTSWTELRLRFSKDDDDDGGADFMKFYSGNYSTSSYRPQLVVAYTLP